MQGSCRSTDPVPVGIRDFGEQLLEMDNGECILSAEHGIFRLMQDNHYLWLDRLYLRSAPRGSMEYGREHRLLDVDGDGSKVWVSVCTLQGKENYGEAVMLWSQTGAVHFEGASSRPPAAALGLTPVALRWVEPGMCYLGPDAKSAS